MRKLLLFLICLSLSVSFLSCSTDVDIYAEYKDISIVYGMIEPESDTTWIKVTKAFLGPGNALLIAQNPDSSQYSPLPKVILKAVKNGVDQADIVLDTITINNKLAGDSIFYFPQQTLFYTTKPIDPTAVYTLVIEKENGQTVQSTTPVVQNFGITFPTNRINFQSTTTSQIRWVSAVNGKRYETKLQFHYKELLPGNPDTLNKIMTWNLDMQKSVTTKGGETIEVIYTGEEFYQRLGNQLENILNVKRWAGPVDVIVACGADELSTYIDVNTPTNSIIQQLPEYTNIENGNGIFSSRRTIVKRFPLTVGSELKLVEDYNWGFVVNR
ncbi:MAG: hypothetical protein Q8S18_11950 [Bacteroidales bacterium]|nr:hypothetical protein [Bacteroidales bacterium]